MAIRLYSALGIDIVSVFDHIMFLVESCYEVEGGEGKSTSAHSLHLLQKIPEPSYHHFPISVNSPNETSLRDGSLRLRQPLAQHLLR